MRTTQLILLIALTGIIAAGCSASGSTLNVGDQQQPVRSGSSYDPFAPSIEVPPLDSALDDAAYISLEDFRVTALDDRNLVDDEVMSALNLEVADGVLTIGLDRPVAGAALYVTYDAKARHFVRGDASRPDGINLVLEAEPGLIAAGVSGLNDSELSTGLPLARLWFAPGPSVAARYPAAISQDGRTAVHNLDVADNMNATVTLQWSERNTGDYDLNGEVNISDITPIGMNFGASYTTESPDYAQLEVIDGDENTEINLADITPIGANFRSNITGYNIYRTPLTSPDEIPDAADTGRWTKVENAAEPTGPSAPRDYNGQDFRLVYTFLDESGDGDFGWYVAPTGLPGDTPPTGPAGNVFTLSVGPPEPPDAGLSFEIMPPSGPLMNINNEFYVAVNIADVSELFSANVRFEYDGSLLEFIEGVSSYDLNVNLLEPPLFISVDDVGNAADPYVLLGFNATQTQGTPTKSGSGALGYFRFKAIAEGINDEAFRFPQASNFMLLWGEDYGVPIATPVLGGPQIVNIGP